MKREGMEGVGAGEKRRRGRSSREDAGWKIVIEFCPVVFVSNSRAEQPGSFWFCIRKEGSITLTTGTGSV